MDLAYKTAVVLKATAAQGLRQELIVECDGEEAQAVNFLELTGPCRVGDQVVINTTAVDLKLGTGGWHFVMAIWGRSASLHGVGHIMKLRYTPMQGRVLSVEEEASEYHHLFQGDWSLEGAPVMVGSLHSMLAPCAFAFKARHPGKRLAYLMSDGAGLPLALSRTVPDLKARGLVDAVITFGHAFGGDYEAVNIYSALVAARHACGDAVVVLMGPGVVGTGTMGHHSLGAGRFPKCCASPSRHTHCVGAHERKRLPGLGTEVVITLLRYWARLLCQVVWCPSPHAAEDTRTSYLRCRT